MVKGLAAAVEGLRNSAYRQKSRTRSVSAHLQSRHSYRLCELSASTACWFLRRRGYNVDPGPLATGCCPSPTPCASSTDSDHPDISPERSVGRVEDVMLLSSYSQQDLSGPRMARSTDAVRIRSWCYQLWTVWARIVRLETMLVVSRHSLSASQGSS